MNTDYFGRSGYYQSACSVLNTIHGFELVMLADLYNTWNYKPIDRKIAQWHEHVQTSTANSKCELQVFMVHGT